MAAIKWNPGGSNPVTILDTALNSLGASTGTAVSSSLDADADGFLYVDLLLDVTFGSAPTADSIIECWIIRSTGGGTFEDGSSSTIVPRNGLAGVWSVRAVTTQQIMCIPGVMVPPADYKVMVVNKTNQAFPASGSTVKGVYYGLQSV